MKRNIVLLTILFFVSALTTGAVEVTPGITRVKGPDGRQMPVSVSRSESATDVEGRLRNATRFYSLKFRYKDNYFGFNLPAPDFEELSEAQVNAMIRDLLGLYDTVFERYAEIFGNEPREYRFNVVFGRTASGHPYNRIYSVSKTSNIYPDCLPFGNSRDVFTSLERRVILHEIGHSLFGIVIGGMKHPKFRFIEEGFIEYVAVRDPEKYGRRIVLGISRAQAENMKGLAQLDLDSSIWGKGPVMGASAVKGYRGITHHLSGIEFVKAFIDTFGESELPEFLKRLKAKDLEITTGDYGTGQIKDVLKKMGYTEKKIDAFEEDFHRRLRENIFKVE